LKPLAFLREDLQGILDTQQYKIYTQENRNILQDLFEGLKNWLYQILQSIFPHADVAKRTSEWLAYGISSLGLLLLFLLLLLLLSRFVRQGQVNSKQVLLAKGQTPTAQQHLEEGHSLAEEGSYNLALRSLFLGYILYLDQNSWLEAKTWKTNWEYYSELKDRAPQLANSFYTLIIKFEEAMFGGRPIARDDYLFYHNQVRKWIHEGDTR
jgi:hypothetical protein